MPVVTPTPIPLFTGTFPDPSDRSTYGIRGRAMWLYETDEAVPGINTAATQTNQNATFAAQMATQAASIAGFVGEWGDQTGAATMPMSVLHVDPETDEPAFWVLMQDVADITAHEPGVSIVWASFSDGATALNTIFNDTVAALGASNVQAAIEALVTRVNNRVSRTGPNGSAELPSGTTAQQDVTPTAGRARWNTSLNEGRGALSIGNGTLFEQEGWVNAGTLSTTSGTEVVLNDVPAWINELEFYPRQVSFAGSTGMLVQLGTAVAFETSGYFSGGDGITDPSGFELAGMASGNQLCGTVRLRRNPGNVWNFDFSGAIVNTGSNRNCHGYKALSGPLTRVRFASVEAVAFDLGSIPYAWRK